MLLEGEKGRREIGEGAASQRGINLLGRRDTGQIERERQKKDWVI